MLSASGKTYVVRKWNSGVVRGIRIPNSKQNEE